MNARNIHFFSEDTSFVLKRKTWLRQWIIQSILSEGFSQLGQLNFIFCSDSYLLQINQDYLDHDTYTDIITFDQSEKENEIAGDIYISIERVWDNATQFKVDSMDELHRVMIHGVLHLCGYTDKTKADKKEMTEKENFYLAYRNQIQ